jgi:hypothetical protein
MFDAEMTALGSPGRSLRPPLNVVQMPANANSADPHWARTKPRNPGCRRGEKRPIAT